MRKVTFSVSTGYVGARREETVDIDEWFVKGEDYETEEELEELIGKAFEDWVWENLDSTWYFEED